MYDEQLEVDFVSDIHESELAALVCADVLETACPDGCCVEPDGKCCHGYSSPLLLLGII